MAITIDVTREDLATLFVRVRLTGLSTSQKYDVFRLQLRYLGDDDAGNPVYSRELPDRRGLWRAVAHRVGWQPSASSVNFRDYEVSLRPTVYYVCASAVGGPHEWDFENGRYPVGRGVLDTEVIHFNRDIRRALDAGDNDVPGLGQGDILLRSTQELNRWHTACVVDIDSMKYGLRATEHTVLGTEYPVLVADTREARRGSITLKVDTLGQYNEVRGIVYPASGRVRPVILNSGGDATMLIDDSVVIPLDVSVEQATQADADLRFIHIDFLEINPGTALSHRTGDDDALVNEPNAHFSISDTTPRVGQWITLDASSSTGQFDSWDWTIERGRETDNKVGKFYSEGPHKIRFGSRGRKTIKLRIYGSGAGANTRVRTITVH